MNKPWYGVALILMSVGNADAASRAPVAARHGMVVTAQHLATEIGVDVLKHGGNAVDAAVAVGYALAVTYPAAGNIGGGGFMTIQLADGRKAFLDFRETAPLAATPDMYLDKDGNFRSESSATAFWPRPFREPSPDSSLPGKNMARAAGRRCLSRPSNLLSADFCWTTAMPQCSGKRLMISAAIRLRPRYFCGHHSHGHPDSA